MDFCRAKLCTGGTAGDIVASQQDFPFKVEVFFVFSVSLLILFPNFNLSFLCKYFHVLLFVFVCYASCPLQ